MDWFVCLKLNQALPVVGRNHGNKDPLIWQLEWQTVLFAQHWNKELSERCREKTQQFPQWAVKTLLTSNRTRLRDVVGWVLLTGAGGLVAPGSLWNQTPPAGEQQEPGCPPSLLLINGGTELCTLSNAQQRKLMLFDLICDSARSHWNDVSMSSWPLTSQSARHRAPGKLNVVPSAQLTQPDDVVSSSTEKMATCRRVRQTSANKWSHLVRACLLGQGQSSN